MSGSQQGHSPTEPDPASRANTPYNPPSRGSIIRGAELRGTQSFDCDVAIIGSGASGAVLACVLAEAGARVMVLEEGDHHKPADYTRMRPTESMRNLWREGGMSAAIGIGDTPIINVTMGRCVGGSSVITGGVCFRTPGAVLDVWKKERGLNGFSEAELDPYFSEVEQVVNVETVPVNMRSRSTQLFVEGAEKLGIEMKPTRRNTKNCDGHGRCNFGCPKQAKLSVDLTFLPRAIRAGATVLCNALVRGVDVSGATASSISGRLLNGGRGSAGDRFAVHAKFVVVAAGGAHTPLLLKQSGLAKASGQVGRNLTLHPSFRMIARFDERVEGWRGAMQSAYSDTFEDERVTLMSVFLPPGTIATGIPGYGSAYANRTDMLPHLAMFGALLHDEAGGRVRRGIGREPLMTYKLQRGDRHAVPLAVRKMGEAFLAAGARELFVPVLGSEPMTPDQFQAFDFDAVPRKKYECSSQHPLGTCRMGSDASNSAIDSEGKVWGLDNVYVVDGSAVPTSLGVNPQLTIMALALRFAHKIRARLFAP